MKVGGKNRKKNHRYVREESVYVVLLTRADINGILGNANLCEEAARRLITRSPFSDRSQGNKEDERGRRKRGRDGEEFSFR